MITAKFKKALEIKDRIRKMEVLKKILIGVFEGNSVSFSFSINAFNSGVSNPEISIISSNENSEAYSISDCNSIIEAVNHRISLLKMEFETL